MKKLLLAALVLCILASQAIAARTVFLKDGSVIQAKSVWRSQGKVQVLVNRDTLAEFWPEEVDMKRTFASQHRVTRKRTALPQQTTAAAPNGAAAVKKPAEKKSGISLPSLPKLPERKPESLIPGDEEGTIRKHKKEMLERVSE